VSSEEIADALRKFSNTSAPEPDSMPYGIWKKVNKLNPSLLTSLLSLLLIHGHHPASRKRANGIVLSKPGKADYKSPASYYIIVLLKTVSEILERITVCRRASLTRNSGLLHSNQYGTLANLGCLDAVSTISHEVRLLQSTALKVSTWFLNIKGGFDNVNANQLSTILLRCKTPEYLVSWVRSFLSQHCCNLIFQGSPDIFAPVAVVTPQGLPISPLLFVIYVSGLHLAIPKGLMVSYVDDFTVTVASPSYHSNIQRLQSYFLRLQSKGARLGVSFSVPKTEFLHWHTASDRGPVASSPIIIDDLLFMPLNQVRWLGYWLTPAIETSLYFSRRLALAEGSFVLVRHLSTTSKGLSSWCNRKLAAGLILPILTYGCDFFTPNAHMLGKLGTFWNRVLRWTTNCFNSTNILVFHLEASLPPIKALLAHRKRLSALRLVYSSPLVDSATARIPVTVPTRGPFHAVSYHHLLLGIKEACRPVLWTTKLTNTTKHLPLEALCHLIQDTIMENKSLPPANSHPHPPTSDPSYLQGKTQLCSLLLKEWKEGHLPPPGYGYPPSTTPHACMGLSHFMSGWIHQMRSSKSYLFSHTSWFNKDTNPLCQYCEEDDESFEHAILHCPAKAEKRVSYLSGITDLSPSAPLWSSVMLIQGLANYISATHTGFPPSAFKAPLNPKQDSLAIGLPVHNPTRSPHSA